MKSIRISDEAYKFLSNLAIEENRSLIATLDLFVKLFKEGQDEELEKESLPSSYRTTVKDKVGKLDKDKKKSI